MKNLGILAILLLACGGASLCRADDITYNVNLTIGSATVTGFIETDGTIGPYTQGTEPPPEFVDWNLQLTEGTSTVDLLGPLSGSNSTANVEDLYGHGVLSATPTQLLYDFGGGYAFFSFYTPVSNTDLACSAECSYLNFDDEGTGYTGSLGGEALSVDDGPNVYVNLSGEQVIGTASASATPEPGTFTLLGSGLLGLYSILRKRTRRRASPRLS